MRLLLDSHALIWWFAGKNELSPAARAAVADSDNEIYVSAVSAWEISTKFRIGKLPKAAPFANDIASAIASQAFSELGSVSV
ncbi:MAG TPA: type II toxin-antitoxin system VapC family toxin [Stellaceae bacterium]